MLKNQQSRRIIDLPVSDADNQGNTNRVLWGKPRYKADNCDNSNGLLNTTNLNGYGEQT
ncbi:MAG: hypothetical protein SLagBPW_18690 [Shewanella algae]